MSALAREIAEAATARKRRRDAMESAGGARPEALGLGTGRAAKLPSALLGRWAAVAAAERDAQAAEEAAAAAERDPFQERTAAAKAWRAQLDADLVERK